MFEELIKQELHRCLIISATREETIANVREQVLSQFNQQHLEMLNEEKIIFTTIPYDTPIPIAWKSVAIVYENLYSFAVAHGIVVPYYKWVYDDTNELIIEVFSQFQGTTRFKLSFIDKPTEKGYVIEEELFDFSTAEGEPSTNWKRIKRIPKDYDNAIYLNKFAIIN